MTQLAETVYLEPYPRDTILDHIDLRKRLLPLPMCIGTDESKRTKGMIPERNFISVNGMALGEETKGNTVQSLVRHMGAHTVWRSGGWQGGHHIIHDDGREMGFSFYGAGTFEGAQTYLRNMVISPAELFQEAMELEEKGVPNALSLITIDEDCLTTTPFHSAISRIREIMRGENKKGTVGKGVGEAMRDAADPELTIRAGDFHDRITTKRRAEAIRQQKLAIAQILIADHKGTVPDDVYVELEILKNEDLVDLFADACKYLDQLVPITNATYLKGLLSREGTIVNEVSHGVLHHPRHGFAPHTTQIDPTSSDVIKAIKAQKYTGSIHRIGAIRTYLTRHGAGPLVSVNPSMNASLPETHNNAAHDWIGEFRIGNFDIVALRYALAINKDVKAVDGLMISYMDSLVGRDEWDVCEGYEYAGKETDLDAHFVVEDGVITGIKLRPDTYDDAHYQHQLKLTRLLQDCKPILTTLRPKVGQSLEDVFIAYVEAKLGVPVVGKAYGPKATDRQYLPSFDEIMKSHR